MDQNTFCRFLKNTVTCEFPCQNCIPFIYFTLLVFKFWQKQFSQKATPVPNYEGVTILKRQIWQKKFLHLSYAPRQPKKFRCPGIDQLR